MACVTDFLAAFAVCLLVSRLNVRKVSAVCYTRSMNAYWVPVEGKDDISYNGFPISLTGPKTTPLVDSNGAVIASVAEITLQKCKEEGTCYVLRQDSTEVSFLLVTYVGGGNVFKVLNIDDFPLGVGGWNNALDEYVSVASSDFTPGTKLYVKELDGLDLGRGQAERYRHSLHNGCVRVDDVGSGACSLNFFVGFFSDFRRVRAGLPVQVKAEPRSNCVILPYRERMSEE